jgi:large subunit ribosomal protein L21
MFAVIETGGKQYIVEPNQTIKINKLPENVGVEVIFNKVLLLAQENGDIQLGTPCVAGAQVKGKVLEQGRDKKIRVVKFKRKVRYHRVKGHRQYYTKVKIEGFGA